MDQTQNKMRKDNAINQNWGSLVEYERLPLGGIEAPLEDHLHSFSNAREIRNTVDRLVHVFYLFWNSVENWNPIKPFQQLHLTKNKNIQRRETFG